MNWRLIFNPWGVVRNLRAAVEVATNVADRSQVIIDGQAARLHHLSERLGALEAKRGPIAKFALANLPEFDQTRAAEPGYAERLSRNVITELMQLRRVGLSEEDKARLDQFRESGVPPKGMDVRKMLIDGDNAKATEVKFRQVKSVNQGLRRAIKNAIINLAIARTMPAGSNERGEIEVETLHQMIEYTDLPTGGAGLADAVALGHAARGTDAPKSEAFHPATADPCSACGMIHAPGLENCKRGTNAPKAAQ